MALAQSTFSERLACALEKTMRKRGVRPEEMRSIEARAKWLASKLDISSQAVRKWLTDQGMPTTSRLRHVADLLGTTVDYLSSGSGPESSSSATLTADEWEVINIYRHLPRRSQAAVAPYLESLRRLALPD